MGPKKWLATLDKYEKPSTDSQSHLFRHPRIHDVRTMVAFINIFNIPSRFEIVICLLRPPTKSLFTMTRRGIRRKIHAIFPIGKGLLLMKAVVASMLISILLLYSSFHGVHSTKGCSTRVQTIMDGILLGSNPHAEAIPSSGRDDKLCSHWRLAHMLCGFSRHQDSV